MAKRQLSATDAFELRQALHIATLDALMASRRWEPGDLVFQGGTSLHLVHGSPRFSEDLDFLVKSALRLDPISESVRSRLEGAGWLPRDTQVSISKSRDGRNPHAFVVAIGGPDVLGAVRVKVELWQTEGSVLSAIKAVVTPVKLARGPASGMQTFVPTAGLAEIYADKVFALAARPYLKPRDVFDLHWIRTLARPDGGQHQCGTADLLIRLATYPSQTPSTWLARAFARRVELEESEAIIASDLRRWLPSSWPVTVSGIRDLIETAVGAIEQGIATMQEIEAAYRSGQPRPPP